MRICLVALQLWPGVGGSESLAEKQARCLQQMGQEVLIVTLRHQRAWPAREKYSGVSIIRVGGLYRGNGQLRVGRWGHLLLGLLVFLTLWRLRQRYDLVHTLHTSPLAVIAALTGRLAHRPVIIGVQNTGPDEEEVANFSHREMSTNVDPSLRGPGAYPEMGEQSEPGGDLAALEKTAWVGRRMLNYLRKSDVYCQILSSRSYMYLIQHGFRPERLVYIPNGVDTQQFYPNTWGQEKEFEQERMLLCVARLEYAKGIDVLLSAWARLMSMPASWRGDFRLKLCLAGDGTQRRKLEAMVLELGIQQSVEFLGIRHDIAGLMQKAWGFVLPSRWEGMPNALLEAMACGLPCLATRVSGSEDVIEQGINGLLVEPEQPELLAYALRLLIGDASLARKLGWQGYETILNYYQLSLTVQGSMAFYRYLLAGKKTVGRDLSEYQREPGLYPEEWQRYD